MTLLFQMPANLVKSSFSIHASSLRVDYRLLLHLHHPRWPHRFFPLLRVRTRQGRLSVMGVGGTMIGGCSAAPCHASRALGCQPCHACLPSPASHPHKIRHEKTKRYKLEMKVDEFSQETEHNTLDVLAAARLASVMLIFASV